MLCIDCEKNKFIFILWNSFRGTFTKLIKIPVLIKLKRFHREKSE